MPAVKDVGEPCAGEPHARFEVAAGGNQASRAHTAARPRRLPPTRPPCFGCPAPSVTARRRDRPDAQAATRCGRSLETARRSEHPDACGYGYCRSHSRWFWGMRLHLACAPGGTPRAAILAPADQTEREVALRLLPLAAPRRRSAHLRQGLRGPRVRADGGRTLRGQAAAPKPRRRTRQRAPPLEHSPAGRVGLLDPQRPTRTRAPPGPAPSPASAHASLPSCSRSPPESGSTTYSAAPAEPSPNSPSSDDVESTV